MGWYAKSWYDVLPCLCQMCSPAMFETHFYCHKDIWIAVTYYCMYFYLTVLFALTAILHLINLTAT